MLFFGWGGSLDSANGPYACAAPRFTNRGAALVANVLDYEFLSFVGNLTLC